MQRSVLAREWTMKFGDIISFALKGEKEKAYFDFDDGAAHSGK